MYFIWDFKVKFLFHPVVLNFYDDFHTSIAVVPPKNKYNRFFTSCVISKPYPSPTTACHDDPNFLSKLSLIIFAAA